MKWKAVVIKSDRTIKVKEIDGYNELKRFIPGILQGVPFGETLDGDKTALLFCDEDGEDHSLPINIVATTIFQNVHPIGLDEQDMFVGTIVVIGTSNQGKDSHEQDVPDWFIDKIKFMMR